jgi:hypothetical protein
MPANTGIFFSIRVLKGFYFAVFYSSCTANWLNGSEHIEKRKNITLYFNIIHYLYVVFTVNIIY